MLFFTALKPFRRTGYNNPWTRNSNSKTLDEKGLSGNARCVKVWEVLEKFEELYLVEEWVEVYE